MISRDFFRVFHNGCAYGKRQYKKKKETKNFRGFITGHATMSRLKPSKVIPNQLLSILFHARSMLRTYTHTHVYKRVQTIKLSYFSSISHYTTRRCFYYILRLHLLFSLSRFILNS